MVAYPSLRHLCLSLGFLLIDLLENIGSPSMSFFISVAIAAVLFTDNALAYNRQSIPRSWQSTLYAQQPTVETRSVEVGAMRNLHNKDCTSSPTFSTSLHAIHELIHLLYIGIARGHAYAAFTKL